MNIEELKSYLSNECDRALSSSKNNNLSVFDFKNYLEEPIKTLMKNLMVQRQQLISKKN